MILMRGTVRTRPDLAANIRRIESHVAGGFDERLLEKIPTKDELDRALISAANQGELEKVRSLIDQGADPGHGNKVGMRAIDCARIHDYYRVVEFLEKTANKNMFSAIKNDNFEKFKKALDAGANPNAKTKSGMPILTNAVGLQRIRMTELLVEKGADVNMMSSSEHTPLMMAVIVADLKLVKFLVGKEADPDRENKYMVSAKSLAITHGHIAISNCLENK